MSTPSPSPEADPVEQTFDARDGPVAPPPYETLGPPSHLHFHNPRFGLEEGEEEDEEDLPPPYSPTMRPGVLDAPPDYYSLFGQIRDARNEARNSFVFLQKLGRIILNTVGCTVLLIVFMSIPLAMLVLGALNFGSCELEPNIPIFLVIGGFSGTMKNLILIVESGMKRCSHRMPPESKKVRYVNYIWKALNLMFNMFLLGWIIAGSYWIYHIYPAVNMSGYQNATCDELLYKFSFGILTSSYILLFLMLFFVCCCGLCLRRNRSNRADPEEDEGEEEEEEEGEESETGSGSSGSHMSGSDGEGSSEAEVYGVESGHRRQRRHRDRLERTSVSDESGDDGSDGSEPGSPPVARQSSTVDRQGASWTPFPGALDSSGEPELELTEYTSSPLLSPSRSFHPSHPPSSLPPSHPSPPPLPPSQARIASSELYVTEDPHGYSCTSV